MNEIMQAVVLVLVVIVASVVVVYLLKLWQVKQVQLNQEKWSLFNWIVSRAVIGVEQLWQAKLIEKDARLARAVDIVQNELNAWGVRGIDVKQITDACISAVGSELNKARLVAQPNTVPGLSTGPQ